MGTFIAIDYLSYCPNVICICLLYYLSLSLEQVASSFIVGILHVNIVKILKLAKSKIREIKEN